MKKIASFLLLFVAINITLFAQKKEEKKTDKKETIKEEDLSKLLSGMDSIEKSFTYQHGTITLKNGVATIQIPEGFKYLDAKQAEKVLFDLWGNPRSENMTLGLLLPENQGIVGSEGYVFNIQYDEMGYVKDGDADDINYDDLLKQMKEESAEENKDRVSKGFNTATIVGWASKPFYDKERKILHWAKEIKFGTDSGDNTLNYNVRILGRKGVMVLNAIATMPNLPLVKTDINKVLNIVQFTAGNQYKDFDSKIDNVAAWTIGGLVAGKILAKVGFLAVILKFWKIGALAVAGFFSLIWKRIKRKKDDETETVATTETPLIEENNTTENQA